MAPRTKYFVSLLLVISCPLAAQDQGVERTDEAQKRVDEAKLLVTELSRLGDPDLNKFLPELYWSLRAPLNSSKFAKRSETVYEVSGLMKLLQNAGVRKELQIGEVQYRDFLRLKDTITAELNGKIVSRLLEDNAQFDPVRLREQIANLRNGVSAEMEKLFVPAQLERLKQLAYQTQMAKRSVVDVLTSEPVASELNLSDKQKADLRKAAHEIEQEFAREVAKLRTKAKQKLFSRLKSDQQRKLSKIVGDEFDYQSDASTAGFGISRPSATAKSSKGKARKKSLPGESDTKPNRDK